MESFRNFITSIGIFLLYIWLPFHYFLGYKKIKEVYDELN